jgi:hypothetical protein
MSIGDIILIMVDYNEVFWVLNPTGFQEKFWFRDFWFDLAESGVVYLESELAMEFRLWRAGWAWGKRDVKLNYGSWLLGFAK